MLNCQLAFHSPPLVSLKRILLFSMLVSWPLLISWNKIRRRISSDNPRLILITWSVLFNSSVGYKACMSSAEGEWNSKSLNTTELVS